MQYSGLIVGGFLFLYIMASRLMCIKGEYYLNKKFCLVFLFIGLAGIICSLLTENVILSSIASILGFVSLWGILETIEQEKRVKNGWYPKRKKRN